MLLLPARTLLAIAAVLDVALNGRPHPVSARALTERHGLPPRHLETILQALVRTGILRSVRGPRGGYELARERRRISLGDIVRATRPDRPDETGESSPLVGAVIAPAIAQAGLAFLDALDAVSVDDLCRRTPAQEGAVASGDFTI